MNGKTYGYVRVSTRDQNEDRQVLAMQEFGVDRLFIEKQSGKDFERPVYQQVMSWMGPGDTLVIKSIDRLGRNYREILEQWREITKEKQAAIVVLDMPLLDTRRGWDLTGMLIADIVLQLLSYVAEMERVNIRHRQAEGIAAAKQRGVKFGAPTKRTDDFEAVYQEYRRGRITLREAADRLGVHHKTFLRWTMEENSQNMQ